ncbi:response regulator transcription factor [Nocardioides anomalus]|uniref:Response regulator transcription factor n=1 Tax=Nocardioides anomalus TaxID=2712223 RepID=A0A6G6W9P9_9ACTN|nr:response regulator transcription factor [Nocardioides anomalus]QIG41877.1 response regulator transcription factor [Nocardioides anomalus]
MSRHPLTRAGITALLGAHPARVAVLDVASSDGHLSGHDVVIYDLAGLAAGGSEDLDHLVAGRAPVLGLEPLGRPDLGEGAQAMGVAIVVPASISGPGLLQAVERTAAGYRQDPAARRAAALAAVASSTGLTTRELEILALIAQGLRNHDIAARLFLSINSVKSYIRLGYRKIKATSRSEAVLWAVRHDLVRLVGGGPATLAVGNAETPADR